MNKSAGWLKKLKKVTNAIGKGASWVNNNIVKPMKPLINKAINFGASAAGVPMVGTAINAALDYGSDYLDQTYGSSSNKTIMDASKHISDYIEDTQRFPSNRKFNPIFNNRLN